jgi:hypothetical protein
MQEHHRQVPMYQQNPSHHCEMRMKPQNGSITLNA